ncbi:MAG: InlB B-repeat-containing protein [Firmicutes bacterium]|nr:InlB B-repeat-containing protein [Bacillota bacterium]
MNHRLKYQLNVLTAAIIIAMLLLFCANAFAIEPTGPPIDSSFDLKGYATINSSGYPNTVRLTPEATYRYGILWSKNKLDLSKPFTSIQSIYLGHNAGYSGTIADGLAFVLHNDARGIEAVADSGAGLGVYGINYIKNSLVIEFDTYYNADATWSSTDPYQAGYNSHCAFIMPSNSRISASDHYNTQWFNARDVWYDLTIEWKPQQVGQMLGGILSYYFEGTGQTSSLYISDVNNLFKSTQVWWGFSGATGQYTSSPAVSFAKMPLPQTISYTLYYNANGGSGAPPVQTNVPANSFPVISTIKPTRDNYNFLGWATFPTSSFAPYQPGTGICIGNSGDITLYAVWEYAPTPVKYTLFYNANGGSGAPPAQTGILANTFPVISTITPTRENYNFLGWAAFPTSSFAPYQPGTSIGIGNSGDLTLYAVWEYAPSPAKFTLFYNANGGSGAPPAQTGIPANTFPPISTIKPTRENYNFLGWATFPTSLYAPYQPGTSIGIGSSGDITLYAIWEYAPAPVKYTLSFDANGGSGAPSPQTELPANSYASISTTVPTRNNHLFLGWAINRENTNPQYLAGGYIYIGTSNITLYAVWLEMAATYTLSFDANGGNGAPNPQTGLKANNYVNISTVVPTRVNYRFLGWALNSQATNPQFIAGGIVYIGNSDITLYAVWAELAVTTYSLVFDANGGSGAPSPQTGLSANAYAVISSTEPIRNNYHFLGWSTDKNATSPQYPAGGFIYIGTTNIILYAVWQAQIVHSYCLSYDANGGSNAPPPQMGIPENTYPTISTIIPIRSGYNFLGWALSSSATEAPFQPGATISIGNANVILYAIWELQSLGASDEQIVIRGRSRHYNSSGYEVPTNPVLGQNSVVSVEKSIAGTNIENEFDLTLTVKTSVDISQVSTSADAAVILVLDISGSMGGINDANTDYMPALRTSAQNFINSLAAEAGDSARYVALVTFETDAKLLYSWTDITNNTNRQIINTYIQNLPGEGATFLPGGLQLARNLLRTEALPRGKNNTVIDNRSVVLFSDGEANKYTMLTNDVRYNTGVTVIGSSGPGYGFDPQAIALSETMANTVKNLTSFSGYTKYTSYLYTIAFGSAAPTNWLRNTIATNPTYAYTSQNAEDLNKVFAAIAKRIEQWAQAWIVTDPMGANIDFISNISGEDKASGLLDFQNNTLFWDLRKAKADSFANDIYTYTYTYRIRLDNTTDNFIAGAAYPTNKTTQLTYVMVEDSLITSDLLVGDFAIPAVKGYAGGSLTFTKVGGETTALPGCSFKLTNQNKADHALFTNSAVGTGAVSFANIPSGHTYSLAETFMPAAYEGRYHMNDETYTVAISFGKTTLFDNEGNIIDKTTFKFNNPLKGRTVIGFVSPMATNDLGETDFLQKHDIVVELRSTFLTAAPAALSTYTVLQNLDGLGKFTIENVPLGSYILYIRRPGYLTRAMKVTISDSLPDTVVLRPPGTEDNGIFNLWGGDCNGDLIIENKDLMMIMELIDEGVDINDPRYNPACDLNADGFIDDIDLLMVYARFGLVIWDYAGADDIDIFN